VNAQLHRRGKLSGNRTEEHSETKTKAFGLSL